MTPSISIPLRRLSSLSSRPALVVAASALLALSPSLFGTTILFEEDFEGSRNNTPWDGYNGWTEKIVNTSETKWTRVLNGPSTQGLIGAFRSNTTNYPGSDEAGRMDYIFTQPFALADGGYRLSFDIQGRMFRIFQVTLADSADNRVGLQMGFNYSNSQQSVSGVTIAPDGSQSLHRTGGWANTAGATPEDWFYDRYYRVYIDINDTGSDLAIGGSLLASGKARVTYNALDTTTDTFVMTFDLPSDFSDIAAIAMMRPAHNTSFAVDNFRLEVQAIPEPTTAFLVILGGAALAHRTIKTRTR